MTQAVIAETNNPISAAVATKGMNFGALRMSTRALLVFWFGLATRPLNQRKVSFDFGPGSRSLNQAGGEGGIPGKVTDREREPSLWRHLYNVRWGASGVAGTGDALNGPEGRHTNLNRVAHGPSAKFFEEVAHSGGKLRLIARPHGCDGLDDLDNLDFSAHGFILA